MLKVSITALSAKLRKPGHLIIKQFTITAYKNLDVTTGH